MAAAAVATSLFAADISAATQISTDLFNLGADGTINVMGQQNDSHDYANPNFALSVNGDKAGATVKITTDGATLTPAQTTQTIWFKPIDAVKVTVGNYDVALNKETIDWTESFTGLGGNGYLVSINAGPAAIDLGLDQGNKFGPNWGKGGVHEGYWFNKAKDADGVLAHTFAKVGVSGDFGNIGAYVSLNKGKPADWEATAPFYYVDGSVNAVISNIDFGAGYKNTFGGVNVFANVVGHMEKSFEWVRPEVFVSGNASGVGYNLFAAPVIWTNSNLKKDMACEIVAKVTYSAYYVYFKDANVMADKFASTIKIGTTGSVGMMGYDACVQIGTGAGDGSKVTVAVPVVLKANF